MNGINIDMLLEDAVFGIFQIGALPVSNHFLLFFYVWHTRSTTLILSNSCVHQKKNKPPFVELKKNENPASRRVSICNRLAT
jgi:hypothetical protein